MDAHPSIFGPLPVIEAELERVLRACLAEGGLRRAMAYSALGAGKRLRPVLAWHCCEAMSGGRLLGHASLSAGVAVELVHCFSLVHDDLPALDNDDLRRGKPTLHKHAGEAMAILAGDALLSLAFESLSQADAVLIEHLQRHREAAPSFRSVIQGIGGNEGALRVQVALMRELARATTHMIQGQVWDTIPGDIRPPTAFTDDMLRDPARHADAQRVLHQIHFGKTGALIGASCRMGAMIGLGDADEAALRPISTYAEALGVLFQAVDDLLDVTQTAEHAGKRTNKDAEAGKLTYPALYGVEGTRRRISDLQERARAAIEPLGAKAQTLHHIADFLATRTK
jgi:geranylgeranyl diphosphate synthase type II